MREDIKWSRGLQTSQKVTYVTVDSRMPVVKQGGQDAITQEDIDFHK